MAGFTGHRRIPRRTQIVGDIPTGKKLIGYADSQLRILENQMGFQGLKQGSRTVRPHRDIVIECWSCFSLQGIKITVLGSGRDKAEKISLEECMCFPCYAMGIVTNVTEVTSAEAMMGFKYLCDLDICSGKKTQLVKYINYPIRPVGWEKYYLGQYVMVSAFCEDGCIMNADTKKSCLTVTYAAECYQSSKHGFCNLVILPLYNSAGMKEKYKVAV